MSTLEQRLHTDLTEAIRSRDALRMASIRMALAAITTESVAGTASRTLSDDEVVAVITREVKKRREAAEAFTAGGRPDRAEGELQEAHVLLAYLPEQLSDAALAALVTEVIGETGAQGTQGLGVVMKALTPRIAGRADGRRVSTEVRRQLG